jgi:hypothetical protein
MLREWGVEGVQVREVIPLDAVLDSSPYGLPTLARLYPDMAVGRQHMDWFYCLVTLLPSLMLRFRRLLENFGSQIR